MSTVSIAQSTTPIVKKVYQAASFSLYFYAASAMAIPICLVKISEELSLSLTQGGALGFIISIEQFLVILFSGIIAARYGKIKILRAALLFLGTGLILFTISISFWMAILLLLITGIGSGLLEALLTPLVEDLYPKDDGSKMNRLHAFWPLGVCSCVILFGEALSRGISWRMLFIILGLLILGISTLYPKASKISLPRSRADFSHMGEILALKRFWLLGFALFFAGGAEGGFAFWSASFIQLHFETLPRAGAIGTACFAGGMAIGRFLSSHLSSKWGLKKLIIYSTITGLAISISFFLITNLSTLYLFLFGMGLTIACLWPSIQSFGGNILQVDPTLLMIFLSCFGIPGYSSATLLMGIIGDYKGLHMSFIIAPLYLSLVIVFIFFASKNTANTE